MKLPTIYQTMRYGSRKEETILIYDLHVTITINQDSTGDEKSSTRLYRKEEL